MRTPTRRESAGVHCIALIIKQKPWTRKVFKRMYELKSVSGRLDFNIGLLTNIAKKTHPMVEHLDNIELVDDLLKLGLLANTKWGEYKTPIDVLELLKDEGVAL